MQFKLSILILTLLRQVIITLFPNLTLLIKWKCLGLGFIRVNKTNIPHLGHYFKGQLPSVLYIIDKIKTIWLRIFKLHRDVQHLPIVRPAATWSKVTDTGRRAPFPTKFNLTQIMKKSMVLQTEYIVYIHASNKKDLMGHKIFLVHILFKMFIMIVSD